MRTGAHWCLWQVVILDFYRSCFAYFAFCCHDSCMCNLTTFSPNALKHNAYKVHISDNLFTGVQQQPTVVCGKKLFPAAQFSKIGVLRI